MIETDKSICVRALLPFVLGIFMSLGDELFLMHFSSVSPENTCASGTRHFNDVASSFCPPSHNWLCLQICGKILPKVAQEASHDPTSHLILKVTIILSVVVSIAIKQVTTVTR